jgi:uncharacterized membrane protein
VFEVSAIEARRMLWISYIALIGLATAAASVSAHQGHAAKSPKPEAAASATPSLEPEEAVAPEPTPAPLQIDPKLALTTHLHNKVVHFPIALGAAGAVLLLLSYRWPQFGAGARLLLVVAALAAWVAARSGHAQAADLEGGGLDIWLERHEDFGNWTTWALTLTALIALVKRARPVQWLFALLVLALLSATGFLGGILAHPPV